MFTFRKQPLKTLYLLYLGPSVVIRLPYWIVTACIPAFRPVRSWSIHRTLVFYFTKTSIRAIYDLGIPAPEGDAARDSAEPEKTGFVWVEPVPPSMVVGEVAERARHNNVEPVRISGYWYGKRDEEGKHGQRAEKGERVLYHFHGGGHVMGSAAPAAALANIPRGVVEICGDMVQRALSLEYRVASSAPYEAAGPFPAALIDAVAGYRYLIESCGFEPENVIVAGDSSGGHLAVSLVRYLCAANLPGLPKPGALILLSPALDWGLTHDGPEGTLVTNASIDVVTPLVKNGYSMKSLRGNLPEESLQTDAWLSPASKRLSPSAGLFKDFPRTFINASSTEQIVDTVRTFRDRLAADVGDSSVHYIEYPHAFHDFIIYTWHEPERTQALEEIGRWLRLTYGTDL